MTPTRVVAAEHIPGRNGKADAVRGAQSGSSARKCGDGAGLNPATDPSEYRKRASRIVGAGRQMISGNPLTLEEIEMFEMFERENWSQERRKAHIMEILRPRIDRSNADSSSA
jgi:hypothetical protein